MNKIEWKKVKLGEVFTSIRNGANIKQYDDAGGIPITRIETLSNDTFNRDRLGYANIIDSNKYSDFLLEDEDILMSHINSLKYLGRAVLYKKQNDETIIHGMNLLRLKPNKEVLISSYITHYFTSNQFKGHIGKIAKKSVNQASFSISDLKEIKVQLPSLLNQRHIATTLDKANELIALRKKQLEELDALAESVFYELFGDPVRNEKRWVKKKWKEVFNTKTGKLDSNAMCPEGKYPFFTCAKEIYQIDNYAFDCEALLLAGNNATANYDVKYYKGKFNAYQRTYVLTLLDKNYSYSIFKIQLESKLDLLKEQSIGANTKYLTLKILEQLDFICPPLPLQTRFSTIIEKIEEQKALVRKALKDSEDLFGRLMQEMFGEG